VHGKIQPVTQWKKEREKSLKARVLFGKKIGLIEKFFGGKRDNCGKKSPGKRSLKLIGLDSFGDWAPLGKAAIRRVRWLPGKEIDGKPDQSNEPVGGG